MQLLLELQWEWGVKSTTLSVPGKPKWGYGGLEGDQGWWALAAAKLGRKEKTDSKEVLAGVYGSCTRVPVIITEHTGSWLWAC